MAPAITQLSRQLICAACVRVPGRSWARAEMYLRVLVVLEAAADTGPSPGLHLLINTTTATTLDPLNVTYDPVKILEILKYFKSICL